MAITPIVDRSRRFTHFKMDEIYTGPAGTGRWVPNVDDMVTDWEQGFYRVVAVDHERTNLSYLQKVNFNSMGGGVCKDRADKCRGRTETDISKEL
jgi:hypothetical protein